MRDHLDDERPPWCWETTLMLRDHLIMKRDHLDDDRPPWWWETTLMLRDHLDVERPPWCWETTLIMKRDHLDVERPAWWPPWWWETTLMRGHPSFNSLLPYPATLGCIIGRCCKTFGERSYGYIASTVWNSLPADLRASPSLPAFKDNLKMYLFRQAFWLICTC